MGVPLKTECEFCGAGIETEIVRGIKKLRSYCDRCVELRVWIRGRGRRTRYLELNPESVKYHNAKN